MHYYYYYYYYYYALLRHKLNNYGLSSGYLN
jgi:hypothetical protein